MCIKDFHDIATFEISRLPDDEGEYAPVTELCAKGGVFYAGVLRGGFIDVFTRVSIYVFVSSFAMGKRKDPAKPSFFAASLPHCKTGHTARK